MNYVVGLEPDYAGSWIARVPEVTGCHTFGRTLEQARGRIREALELWRDDAVEATFNCRIRLPDDIDDEVKRYRDAKDELRRAHAAHKTALKEAILALTEDAGISTRDAAEVLGLSHQYIGRARRTKSSRAPAPAAPPRVDATSATGDAT